MTQDTEWYAERQPNTVGEDWWRAIIYGRYGKTIVSHLDEPTARVIAASKDTRDVLAAIFAELLDGDYVSAEQIAKHAGQTALAKSRPKT